MTSKIISWNKALTLGGYCSLALGIWTLLYHKVFGDAVADLDNVGILGALTFFVIGSEAIHRKYFNLFLVMIAANGLLGIWGSLQGWEYMGKVYSLDASGYVTIAMRTIALIMVLGIFYYSTGLRSEFNFSSPYPEKPTWYRPVERVLLVLILGLGAVSIFMSIRPILW